MSDLLLVGDDKIGHKLLIELKARDDLLIVLDRSSTISRVLRLMFNGVLPVSLLMKMLLANFLRRNYSIPKLMAIRNNAELLKFIDRNEVDRIFLFRAGLIVTRKILNSVDSVQNIHCAKIPEYGGLGALQRALKDNAYNQVATLHLVTDSIDKGQVLDTEAYQLKPELSYRQNEDIAYDAGIRLVKKILLNRSC